MKLLLSVIVSFSIVACSTTPSGTTPSLQQAAKTATGLFTLASAIYTQYNQDKGGKVDPTTLVGQVNADLNGVATLLQGYVGSRQTPAQVNAAQGAANPVPAATVIAALPATPITQQMVNTVFAAAAQVK